MFHVCKLIPMISAPDHTQHASLMCVVCRAEIGPRTIINVPLVVRFLLDDEYLVNSLSFCPLRVYRKGGVGAEAYLDLTLAWHPGHWILATLLQLIKTHTWRWSSEASCALCFVLHSQTISLVWTLINVSKGSILYKVVLLYKICWFI